MGPRAVAAGLVGVILALGAPAPLRAASPSPAATPTASNQPVFGVQPLLEGSTTLSHGHFRYDTPAGTTVSDAVIVQNFSDSPLEMTVYPADLIQVQGGGFAPAQQDAPRKDVGAWITISHTTFTIPPKTNLIDPFTLTVPKGTDPGDHVGSVVAAANIGSGGGVNIQGRTALIVEVVIPGQANPAANLTDLTAVSQGKLLDSFTVSVVNTGNVLLTVNGTVTIKDSSGNTVATLPLTPKDGYVIPHGTLDLKTDAWQASPGDYTAQANITAVTRAGTPLPLSSNVLKFGFLDVVRLIITIVIVLVILLLLLLLVRRERRRRQEKRAEAERRRQESELQDQVKSRLRKI